MPNFTKVMCILEKTIISLKTEAVANNLGLVDSRRTCKVGR